MLVIRTKKDLIVSELSNFHAYGEYYDLLNSEKDYLTEAAKINELILTHYGRADAILEFGSGTGRHARILADHFGYKVEGIELSAVMASLATEAKGVQIHVGDIRHLVLNRKFDVVLSMFHVLSYQVDNFSLESVFENASTHLEKSGLFIFDFWFSPAVLKIGPSKRKKCVQNNNLRVVRFAKPSSDYVNNTVVVDYEIEVNLFYNEQTKVFTERHIMRHFSLPELDYFAEKAGFKRLAAHELISEQPPSNETWAIACVYQKQ